MHHPLIFTVLCSGILYFGTYNLLAYYFQRQFTSIMEENTPDPDNLDYERENIPLQHSQQPKRIQTISKHVSSHQRSQDVKSHDNVEQKSNNRYDEQDQNAKVVATIHKDKKDSVIKTGPKKLAKNIQKLKKDEKENLKRIGFAPQIQDQVKVTPIQKETQKMQTVSKIGVPIQEQKKQRQSFPLVSNTSTPLIKSLKSINGEQFERSASRTKETFRSSRSCCEDYLQQIFTFYCKLSYPIQKDPTFDEINQKVKIMRITNFMAFCRDFKLRQHFSRQRLVEVFKKNSSFHKYLNPQQFHTAVEDLAQQMYENYDEDRRFNKMLVFLQLHNSYSFVRKMNELGVVFRMKNKRGKQVRVSPKYTFKLTPNNGKCQEQIALEVKERTKMRKQLKAEQTKWHRKNKLNKIDELYRNGVKKPTKKSMYCMSYESEMNKASKLKDSSPDNQSGRSNRGYYNPCQILSVRADEKSYIKINEIKKIISVSRLKQYQSDRSYGQPSGSNLLTLDTRRIKINQVIAMAKNSILEQSHCQSQNEEKGKVRFNGCIKKQNLLSSCADQLTDSRYIASPFVMKEVTNRANVSIPRKSKQIKQAENLIESQIKNISRIISEGEVKPRQFRRATAKLQKENTRQMRDLEEMAGANEDDDILKQHFAIEKKYEEQLSKTRKKKYI